jgi:hypothetical protein
VGGKECAVKIIGRKNLNRGIQDDIVVVELLPRDQWAAIEEVVLMDEGECGLFNPLTTRFYYLFCTISCTSRLISR